MSRRANDLRAMRLDKRLTQAEVAKNMRVSQGYYSAVETGQKPSEFATAEKAISRMRFRGSRTAGGDTKAGRKK
jgi:transcriptional regulator with XRE-family HTH domain